MEDAHWEMDTVPVTDPVCEPLPPPPTPPLAVTLTVVDIDLEGELVSVEDAHRVTDTVPDMV